MHELRNEIVDQTNITNFVIMEVKYCGLTRVLRNDNPLSILPKEADQLYAVEMNEELDASEGHKIALVISNVERNRKQNKRYFFIKGHFIYILVVLLEGRYLLLKAVLDFGRFACEKVIFH